MKKPVRLRSSTGLSLVPGAGIEPARLAAGDFESPASTNFTTRAVMLVRRCEALNYGTVRGLNFT
jgi:S-sulfo-L-cysteine synthase (O-acetyl-L-serine-dependent)